MSTAQQIQFIQHAPYDKTETIYRRIHPWIHTNIYLVLHTRYICLDSFCWVSEVRHRQPVLKRFKRIGAHSGRRSEMYRKKIKQDTEVYESWTPCLINFDENPLRLHSYRAFCLRTVSLRLSWSVTFIHVIFWTKKRCEWGHKSHGISVKRFRNFGRNRSSKTYSFLCLVR